MATYPTRGTKPWDQALKAYMDDAYPDRVTTEAAVARVESRTFDVRAFGNVGTDDDGPVLKQAFDAAATAGGGIVTSPLDVHTIKTGFLHPNNVYYRGPGSGAQLWDASGLTTPATSDFTTAGAAILGTGTPTLLPTLAVAVAKDDEWLEFSAAHGLAPKDLICIHNPADFSFAPHRSYYRQGEFARVQEIDSVNPLRVRINHAAFADHPTTVNVYRVDPFQGGLSGVTLQGINGERVAMYEFGAGLHFTDIAASGSNYANLEINRSYGVWASHITSVDYSAFSGLNYGISLGNSQHVYIDHCHLETTRHGFTNGGNDEVCSVPSRDVHITTSFIDNATDTPGVNGMSMHGNAEYVYFDDVTFPHGMSISGDHTKTHNCHIWSSRWGQLSNSMGEATGADHEVINCDWHMTGDYINTYSGPLSFQWPVENVPGVNGTFRFNDNTIHVHGYTRDDGVISTIVGICNLGGLSYENDVEVKRNTVIFEGAPIGDATTAVFVRGDAVNQMTGFRHVDIDGLNGNMGALVYDCAPKLVTLSNINLLDAKHYGVRAALQAPVDYDRTTVVLDNVTILGAQHVGVMIQGDQATTLVMMDQVTALDCAKTDTGSTITNSSMYVLNVDRLIRRDCIVGDTQAIPTQDRSDALLNINAVHDENVRTLGSVLTTYRSGIGSLYFSGLVDGSPEGVVYASPGSQARSTDGNVYRKVGTLAPTGWISLSEKTAVKTAQFTADLSAKTYLCDASAAAFTAILPTAVGHPEQVFTIKKIDATANTVLVNPDGSETVDGAATLGLSTQHAFVTVVSDGANWHVVAKG